MDTIVQKFVDAHARGDKPALLYSKNGQWIEQSWSYYYQKVEHLAGGLRSLGIGRGTHVAIFSETRPEWAFLDMAIMGLGGVTIPLYHSVTPEEMRYILENSECTVLVCENAAYLRRYQKIAAQTPNIKTVVLIETAREKPNETAADGPLTLQRLEAIGAKTIEAEPTFFTDSVDKVKIGDRATLVYTSGTTGLPRGVVITHLQIMSEINDTFPLLGVTPKDRSLCFLPFAHVLGRIEIWGHVLIGYTMGYAEGIDTIRSDLLTVKPTLLIGVPRIFEKIYNGVVTQAQANPLQKRVFNWAVEVGKELSRLKADKETPPIDLQLRYQLGKRLVFDKLNEKLGGELRFVICGGAPLSREIAEFFHAAGLLILEGYGLTETTAAVAVNTPFAYRFGTVGQSIGDVRFKIAGDGEILVQSRKVMKEYWKDPQATADALSDGWFHTGDIGELSSDGFLRITDRKKDLIKTAGGKYVAPQKLEGLLKANPYISQVHIHGDQKKYVVALVTLHKDALLKFANDQKIATKDTAKDEKALTRNPKVQELIRKAVAETNSQLASFESIKNFAILPQEFTIESGELTPSLKIKRKVVDERYKEIIDKLY